MNPRLAFLLRQRALICEHLRWLEGEIEQVRGPQVATAAAGARDDPETPAPAAALAAAAPDECASPSQPVAAEFPAEVDVIGVHGEVRRGCLIYASLACALLAGLIAVIYWRY